jgi:hypothetical protein
MPLFKEAVLVAALLSAGCQCGLQPVEELRPGADSPRSDSGAQPPDAGPCQDDAREDNDALDMSGPMLMGIVPGRIALPEQVACPGDADYFAAYRD